MVALLLEFGAHHVCVCAEVDIENRKLLLGAQTKRQISASVFFNCSKAYTASAAAVAVSLAQSVSLVRPCDRELALCCWWIQRGAHSPDEGYEVQTECTYRKSVDSCA